MPTVFHLDTSMRSMNSVTRSLSQQIVDSLDTDLVVYRDLLINPVPQIDEAWIDANTTAVDDRNEKQRQDLALSDSLLSELQQSDVIVIGVPIYNFGVPAALKAWVDQVCRAGVSFQYTENGPVGLLKNKRAILAIASGGVPVHSPVDFCTPFMRQFLNFVGITEIQVVAADAVAMDAESVNRAKAQIAALAA